jgi:hypothetical protein
MKYWRRKILYAGYWILDLRLKKEEERCKILILKEDSNRFLSNGKFLKTKN